MTEQPAPTDDSHVLQILIAEHANLQAIRSATIFEANGRTSLFLGAVSSGIVALAFVGQMSEMSQAFFLFALILLPSLIFLGLVTFIRVYQTGMEDMIASRNINRIRHYYTEVASPAKQYFMLSTHDDMEGYLQNFYGGRSRFQLFVSTSGLVGVINSVLTAVFVSLLLYSLFSASIGACVIIGAIVFATSVYLYTRYQDQSWQANEKRMTILFPSPTSKPD